ncbi:hypothetical protein EVS84_27345 [Pseudomonas koreensis]|uniref:Uncharacterized protein n=1 Tax=Pseudomonas koreensis TaxID=198620 RepID=A0A4V1WGD7_9PSED|nr:hypothetical protein EVS84_27345 [Pseudomonas koreensis]
MLTKAAGRAIYLWLTDRFREQARSHSEFVACRGMAGVARNPVGVGLLTKAAGQAIYLWLTFRFREQARLWVAGDRGGSAKSCGSGLAHEGGRSGNLSVADTPLSRAGSLPHWFCGLPGIGV